MTGRLWFLSKSALGLTAALMLSAAVSAATVTKQVYVTFDGSLSGTTYTLGPGEIDNSFTFGSNGSATVSGGKADIPGDVDKTSGFYFHGPSLGLGSLTAQNWITEARVSPDVAAADQPSGVASGDKYNHILDVQGDTWFRFNGDGHTPKITQFGFYDGSNEPATTTPDIPANQYTHVALTWTAATGTLEGFINGVSQGALTDGGAPFAVSSPYIGYGFFSRFLNRAIDGKLDAVAFSTFTGTFNPAKDFQLSTVPEPGSLILMTMGLAMVGWFVRK